MDQLLQVVAEETSTGAVIRLVGELDMSTAGMLQPVFDLVLGEGTEITIDLRELRFSDSSGLRELLRVQGYAEAGHSRLALVPGPPQVMRLFEIAGLLESFRFVEDAHQGAC